MGTVFQDQGKLELAIDAYNASIGVKPWQSDVHYNIANVLVLQGKLSEAVKEYNDAIELNPQAANFYNNLGSTLLDLGRIDEAICSYEKAIAINSDLPGLLELVGNSKKYQGSEAVSTEVLRGRTCSYRSKAYNSCIRLL